MENNKPVKDFYKDCGEIVAKLDDINTHLEYIHSKTDYIGQLRIMKAIEALGVAIFIISEFDYIEEV